MNNIKQINVAILTDESGKPNTAIVMAADNGAYANYALAGGDASIWNALKNLNTSVDKGCSDWLFLASRDNTNMLFVQRNRFVAGLRSDDHYIDFNPIISANEDAELHINLSTNGGTMSVSGSKSGTVTRIGELPDSELILFGRNYSGAVALSAMKLYSFAIRGQNNNHNLVPCYHKTDNVAGMYDLATSTFLTNNGTGTFIVGPDVN